MDEAETRIRLIDPQLLKVGWHQDLIRREVSLGAVEIVDSRPRRRKSGRADYLLRVRVPGFSQPVAVAVIEAKSEDLPPMHGLDQGKMYAEARRLNVPFVFASNGHRFVEYDSSTGITSRPKMLSGFPTPDDLRERYELIRGFSLSDAAAQPLLVPYSGGENQRRYYQDAAVRATLEKFAHCEKTSESKRALISLATGAGKTFIAVAILKKLADAGQLRRALFLCDRDELRQQAAAAFQAVFGNNAAVITSADPQRNARVLIGTYQTLDLADDGDGDGGFLIRNYGKDFFSHIVIDECHRSAWGKWSKVLTLNSDAAQIGLTATPRQIINISDDSTDAQISSDNIRHFGDAVYEYDMVQGMEDGYLAACEIEPYDLYHDNKLIHERISGVDRADLAGKTIVNAITGSPVNRSAVKVRYTASELEAKLVMPERVEEMTRHLFERLVANGGPEQKTIIFCARDSHADAVTAAMNNHYAKWCSSQGKKRADPYAFKCTAPYGSEQIPDFKGASQHHVVAATVDLLTTGVDVPPVRNIVFFKYVRSAIAFYQMVGRGTRIDAATDKLMFRILDYTNATRLFGENFFSRLQTPSSNPSTSPPSGSQILEVAGFTIHVSEAGQFVVTSVNGRVTKSSLENYQSSVAISLQSELTSAHDLATTWVVPKNRATLIATLPDAGRSASLIRSHLKMDAYDLFDVLAHVGFQENALTREQRAEKFTLINKLWLRSFPDDAQFVLNALLELFVRGGIDELENYQIFNTLSVRNAGGFDALRKAGDATAILTSFKGRLFS